MRDTAHSGTDRNRQAPPASSAGAPEQAPAQVARQPAAEEVGGFSAGAALEVRRVSVQLGGGAVLEDVSLAARAGEIVALLGPSGCGKTTLLRVIAGLQPHAGEVRWQGRSVTAVPAHRRGFGLVFQDQALFPHLDVARNVAFGLRVRAWGAAERARRVGELLELVGLSGFSRRPVDALSGGEAQRVALARALAPRPRLLMLDEPLAGLDRPLREQLLADLPRILRSLRQTALFVTHDLEEALAVADRVAVMRAGRIAQVAAPRALYERPASVFVARFLGRANILHGTVRGGPAERSLETDLGLLPYDRSAPPGARGAVLIRPEQIDLAVRKPPAGASGGAVSLRGTLQATSFRGTTAFAAVLVRATTLQVLVTGRTTLPPAGTAVTISFLPHAAVVPLTDDWLG